MLRANPRQFFNYKMKGRRASIRNQKRSRHYRSRFDRFLDNHERIVEQERLKKLKKEDPYLPVKLNRPLYKDSKDAGARDIKYEVGVYLLVGIMILAVILA